MQVASNGVTESIARKRRRWVRLLKDVNAYLSHYELIVTVTSFCEACVRFHKRTGSTPNRAGAISEATIMECLGDSRHSLLMGVRIIVVHGTLTPAAEGRYLDSQPMLLLLRANQRRLVESDIRDLSGIWGKYATICLNSSVGRAFGC